MRKRDRRKFVVQRHHLIYQPGLKFEDKKGKVVKLYQSEHWVITQLQRRTIISKGLIKALLHWIIEVKEDAVDLDLED